MKHIKLFEDFDQSENFGVRASDLSKKEFWSKFDYMEGKTADYWANDPGYAALERNLGAPMSSIRAFDSENDSVEEYETSIENLKPSTSIKSNQEYVTGWEYFPEAGIAVAYGDGGAPDWYFVSMNKSNAGSSNFVSMNKSNAGSSNLVITRYGKMDADKLVAKAKEFGFPLISSPNVAATYLRSGNIWAIENGSDLYFYQPSVDAERPITTPSNKRISLAHFCREVGCTENEILSRTEG